MLECQLGLALSSSEEFNGLKIAPTHSMEVFLDENDRIKKFRDRVWFTSKSRIAAEKRLRHYDVASHLSLSMLSTIVVGISVFSENIPQQIPVDNYTIVLSVLAVVFSVIVFGFRFGETAALHRECYLRLDRLRDQELSYSELVQEYHEILSAYPNHSKLDYERVVLDNRFFNNKKLTDTSGGDVNWTWAMVACFGSSQIILWAVPASILLGSVGTMFVFL